MPKTFRDYINESKIELPQSAYTPKSTQKKYEEVSDSAQEPSYTSETPKTNAKNNDYTGLYTSDDNVAKLNSSTPFIGGIVSAVQDIKDRWTQERQNWKSFIKGLGDVTSNPQMTYYVANALLRYINGPKEVLPYNNDLDTSNLIVKLADSLGVGNLLSKIGIGSKGGEPTTHKDYTVMGGSLGSEYMVSNDATITRTGTDKQERVGSAPKVSEYVTDKKNGVSGTRKFVKSLYNSPLFTLKINGDFTSPFLTEDYLGKNNEELSSYSQDNYPGPTWASADSTTLNDPAQIKKFIDYVYNNSPYIQSSINSAGPMGNALYALETLKALHGYEPYSKLSLRNDNIWSIRLYPYSPEEEYKATRAENEDYYNGTLTPPLPITYVPFWTYSKEDEGFSLGIYEFDWEKYTPVQSYDLTIGNLDTETIDLYNGRIQYPLDLSYAMHLRMTILDDADATFTKYMNYYFNKTIDKDSNSRAPMEYSAFVAELVIFKPALKVNFHFRFICVPIEYTPSLKGSETDSTDAALVDLAFQVIGIRTTVQQNQADIGDTILPNDIIHKRWNDVTLTPGTNGNTEDRKGKSVSNDNKV